MKTLSWLLAAAAFGLAVQLLLRITTPAWPAHVPKAVAQSLASYLIVAGLIAVALAVVAFQRQPSTGMAIVSVVGLGAALLAGSYVGQVRASQDSLVAAFGPGWEAHIPAERAEAMLQARWRPTLPAGAKPRWEPDVVYATVPGTGRELLVDVWQPPQGVAPSGLGLVYVHGGYYQMLEKDTGTRPLFRHLARQGHVVVDVGYRLADETDLVGMVGDVKRAIAWLKDRAHSYDVDPQRIVVAGASSGGNLALLAGYTPGHPQLTPDDVITDTTVRAVVAYYGVHDWPAFARLPGDDTLARQLFGGTLAEVPERYALASPLTHVTADAPGTLLLQGRHDQQHLIDAGRTLEEALGDAGARVANVELARTDHAFDLMPPGLGPHSPPAISALYDLERFLAVIAHEPHPP